MNMRSLQEAHEEGFWISANSTYEYLGCILMFPPCAVSVC